MKSNSEQDKDNSIAIATQDLVGQLSELM